MPRLDPGPLPLVHGRGTGIEEHDVGPVLHGQHLGVLHKELAPELDPEIGFHDLREGLRERSPLLLPLVDPAVEDMHLPVPVPRQGVGEHRLLEPVTDEGGAGGEGTGARADHHREIGPDAQPPEEELGHLGRQEDPRPLLCYPEMVLLDIEGARDMPPQVVVDIRLGIDDLEARVLQVVPEPFRGYPLHLPVAGRVGVCLLFRHRQLLVGRFFSETDPERPKSR